MESIEPVSVTTCQLPLDDVDSCLCRAFDPGTEMGLVLDLKQVEFTVSQVSNFSIQLFNLFGFGDLLVSGLTCAGVVA